MGAGILRAGEAAIENVVSMPIPTFGALVSLLTSGNPRTGEKVTNVT